MQARTTFRLAMLRNGFWPLLNDCKRSIEPGWPITIPAETEVLSWDRSALTSTGLKIDGDLAVIDVDVSEADFVDALASAFDQSFPELFAHGLVRHSGGAKEAWFAPVDEPFARFASRRWYRGSDPDDPAVAKHLVECFGSRGTRQFGIDGPHSRNSRGEVISTYRFAGGASPATTPRASLPVLPKAAYTLACDLFDGIAAAAGLTAVKEARRGRGEATPMCFELDAFRPSALCPVQHLMRLPFLVYKGRLGGTRDYTLRFERERPPCPWRATSFCQASASIWSCFRIHAVETTCLRPSIILSWPSRTAWSVARRPQPKTRPALYLGSVGSRWSANMRDLISFVRMTAPLLHRNGAKLTH